MCLKEVFQPSKYLVQRVPRLKDDGGQEEEEEGGRRELLLVLQLIPCLLHNPEQQPYNNTCNTRATERRETDVQSSRKEGTDLVWNQECIRMGG